MKRLVLVLAAAIAFAAPARAQSIVVGVGGELSQLPYAELVAPIYVDMSNASGHKLGSYTIRVSWKPDSLYYVRLEPGAFAVPVVNADSVYYGVLRIGGVSPEGMSGVFDLVRLVFEMPYAQVNTIINVQVTELSAAGTLTDLLGTMTVTTSNATVCTAQGLWGDLDFDGLANSRDALAILSAAVGIGVPQFLLALGDVDGDGVTNTRDALILLSYAVGLDITGQRVLLIAPGACAAGDAPTLEIVPGTTELVIGQEAQLQVRSEDASGTPVGVTGVNWLVDDPAVASMTPSGWVTGRAAGTTTVRASLGPGVVVTGTITVVARRPVWYVDAQVASQRPVQLGTMAYPFATPQYAFVLVQEGDTIRVAPGIHDYEDYYYYGEAPSASVPAGASASGSLPIGPLTVGAVIIGDTLPDGTRPVLRAIADDYLTALPWDGGLRGEVRNLIFRGFDEIVYGGGIRNLVLDNVRIEDPSTSWGDGLYMWRPLDTLIVTNSEFIADTSHYSGYPIYLDDGATLVVVHDSRFLNWGGAAIYGGDIDSLDVRRSEISGIDDYGIRIWSNNLPSVAATLVQNRFVDNYYESLYLDDARSITMQGNYFDERWYDALDLRGTAQITGSVLRSTGDSILFAADDWDWIYATQFDSVLIDSLWLNVRGDLITYQWGSVDANHVKLTNSQLLNLVDGDAFIVGARELVVDNTDFIGCATCNWLDAIAIETWAYNDSGPKVSVTNSTFSTVSYALYHTQSSLAAGPMLIAGNTVDSVAYGFYFKADSALVQNNTLSRIRNIAVSVDPTGTTGRPPRRAVMQGNTITCAVTTSYTSYGVDAYNVPLTFDNNVVTDCDYGVYAYQTVSTTYALSDLYVRGNSFFQPTDGSGQYGVYAYGRFGYGVISRNTVRRGLYGLWLGVDFTTGDTSVFRVDSNAVSQTTNYGVYLPGYDAVTYLGVRNNISSNLLDGLYSTGAGTRSFTLGRFVGNARWAVRLGSGAVDATQNWWGNASGAGGVYGSGQPNADSVASSSITVTSPLTSDPTDVPALVPPAGIAAGPVTLPTVEPAVTPQAVEAEDAAQAAARAAHQERREAREAARAAERQAKLEAMERVRQQRRPGGGGSF